MKYLTTFGLAASIALLPVTGFSEAAANTIPSDMVWIMNTLLFLISGFLVFFMAAGLAML